jgi:integrase
MQATKPRRSKAPRKITDSSVRDLKPGQTIYDTVIRGFRAARLPSGTVTFGLQQTAADGTRPFMKLGLLGHVTVKQARVLAKQYAGEIAARRNPIAEQRAEIAAQQAEAARNSVTVNYVVDQWLERHVRAKSLKRPELIARYFERFVRPTIGSVVVYDLTRDQVRAMLYGVASTAGKISADHTLAYLRAALNWYREHDEKFTTSPITRSMHYASIRESARSRALSHEELRDLWRALDRLEPQHPIFTALVRTLLLTACRMREVADLHASEINGDNFIVPRERYKTGRKTGCSHLVPLIPAIQQVMPSGWRTRPGYVFAPAGKAPVLVPDGRNVFNNQYQLKRLLDDTINYVRAADGRPPIAPWQFRDLRRTARTYMSPAGVDSDTAERCLGHALNHIRGTYDVWGYREEKALAFTKLAEYLDRIVNPDPANVVVPFRPPAAVSA